MSETDTAGGQGAESSAPQFRLLKLYVKDLSLENPNAPQSFSQQEAAPKVDLNLGVKNNRLDDEHWEIILNVNATITDSKNGKTLFILEVEHAGIFFLKHIPEEHMQVVLSVECPNFMFPYTRQIISQASVDAGFPPFLLEPVNFMALYENQKRKQAEETPPTQ